MFFLMQVSDDAQATGDAGDCSLAREGTTNFVMPGLVPGIHVFL